jgi:outer membrane protein assembly factor BamB
MILRASILWAITALVSILIFGPSVTVPQALGDDPSTFEAWEFRAGGNILAMSAIKDVTGDGVNDLVVAALDRSVYLADGVTGSKVWNFDAQEFYVWVALASSPTLDANKNGKSDVLVATKERLLIMLDGATGKSLWNFTTEDDAYRPGTACTLSVRSAHVVSDIDLDAIPDVAVVSGSGDGCGQSDRFSVLALSSKTGEKQWEFVNSEDYHGLKDGTLGSAPVTIIDHNRDGTLDIVVADDQGYLHVVNGKNGDQMRNAKIEVFGSIWNLAEVPDLTGDGVSDAIAFEFIDGAGGPDYASIDAIDIMGSRVIWQVKVGDGLYDGGALYSAAWVHDSEGAGVSTYVAVTRRIDNDLSLILLDAKTGEEKWKFRLGDEQSRDDLDKLYPVARIADTTGQNRDELAVGSIDSRLHLLDPASGSTIWSHPINGEISGISFIPAKEGQKYILVEDVYTGIRALSRQTTIETSLSIEASAQTLLSASRLVITGDVSPSFPGEIVEIRYVDPSGSVVPKSLIVARDGTYTDVIEPETIGTWKVSADFKGEGFYLDSKSPTITFTVVNETKNLVFSLKVSGDGQSSEISYPIVYFAEGGEVVDMSINKEKKSLNIALEPSTSGGNLRIELPRAVIDAWESNYEVYLDGQIRDFDEVESGPSARTLSIPFDGDSSQIQILGTYVVPEFSNVVTLVFSVAMIAAVVLMGMRSRLAIK